MIQPVKKSICEIDGLYSFIFEAEEFSCVYIDLGSDKKGSYQGKEIDMAKEELTVRSGIKKNAMGGVSGRN